MPPDSAPRPATASAIYIRIADFARKPVAEQAALKEQVHGLIAEAVGPLDTGDRIVLDSGEGAAIVVPGSPAVALDTARKLQFGLAGRAFSIGLNHGPVRVEAETSHMAGDALAAAVTVAEFAGPGTLLASRAFREALKAGAPERVVELCKAGDFTDANIRTHELFALDAHAAARRRRRWLAVTCAGVVGVIALGVAGRMVRLEIEASRQPAIIVLDIKPHGQLWLDGRSVGDTPPLTDVPVKAGAHQIEVRHAELPPLKLDVNLEPGERMTVSHTFLLPRKPEVKTQPRRAQRQPGFLENLKRTFGFR